MLCSALSKAQTGTNAEFEAFASAMDPLFIQAYEQRDTKAYEKLLTEFLVKFNALSPQDQKVFSNYYVNAYYNLACTYSLVNNKTLALESLKKAIDGGSTSDYE